MNAFKNMLAAAQGQVPLGTWVMSASPIVAEAIGCAGFDWGVIDMEHSPLDLGDVVHLLQAVAATPMLPLLRVPWNDTVVVKRVLDAGANTVLFPFVQNADEARRAVAATRYPPQGVRGMAGMSRGSRFGTVANHYRLANERIGVIVQLETPAALGQLEAIAAVPGVDALFLGPADLSGAMGHVGDMQHPAVMAAMTQAVQRCKALGMPVGTIGGAVGEVAAYRTIGFDFVAIASDLGLLMHAAQAALTALTALPNEATSPQAKPSRKKVGGY